MQHFDRFLIVDWSASNIPKTGKDSIWLCMSEIRDGNVSLLWSKNASTRHSAFEIIKASIIESISNRRRLFAGFDFAFGYPKGATELIAGRGEWKSLWQYLEREVVDGPDNASNRFELAGAINERMDGSFFWGHPQSHVYAGLQTTKTQAAYVNVPEKRLVEHRTTTAKSVWQLSGAGAVGSQALLGIAWLQRLRHSLEPLGKLAIWPFETRFADDLSADCVVAEIYPSLFPMTILEGQVKDKVQVETIAKGFAELDREGRLEPMLAQPDTLSAKEISTVLVEEGWIVGVGTATKLPEAPKLNSMLDYIRDPDEIYRRSFETIRAEADLSRFPKGMESLVVRLIHACGMTDLAGDIVFADGAFEAGQAALQAGAQIFCDAEMVDRGIIRKMLPAENEVVCLLNDMRVKPLAAWSQTTRSAAQVDLWKPGLEGSVVAIGNAPTALFRLLELIRDGAPKPALILGFPVGFVGAAESKEALIEGDFGVPFITVRGRRGGSAMASAAVNALAGGLGANG